MHHYDRVQWQRYIDSTLQEDIIQSMEEHLYNCDDCMTVYLNLMETSNQVELVTPPIDFTSRVLDELEFDASISRTSNVGNASNASDTLKKKPVSKKRTIFKYYVVAASITMLLMYSGFFQLFNQVSRVTTGMVKSTNRVEELMPIGWSQRIMELTLETLHLNTIKLGSDINENQ